jgi:hypothetical protein
MVPVVVGERSRVAVNAAPSLPFMDTPPESGSCAAMATVAALTS